MTEKKELVKSCKTCIHNHLVENIVEAAGITHAPVFMKDNLADVWGPDLIQDHPKGMVWPEVGGDG